MCSALFWLFYFITRKALIAEKCAEVCFQCFLVFDCVPETTFEDISNPIQVFSVSTEKMPTTMASRDFEQKQEEVVANVIKTGEFLKNLNPLFLDRGMNALDVFS